MSEREAQELIAKADKKVTSSSWFFGGNKYEEAAELYTKAGNIYKMAKRCRSSQTHISSHLHRSNFWTSKQPSQVQRKSTRQDNCSWTYYVDKPENSRYKDLANCGYAHPFFCVDSVLDKICGCSIPSPL